MRRHSSSVYQPPDLVSIILEGLEPSNSSQVECAWSEVCVETNSHEPTITLATVPRERRQPQPCAKQCAKRAVRDLAC
eukprot:11430164-Alexandrium_andersonii.AAC.1